MTEIKEQYCHNCEYDAQHPVGGCPVDRGIVKANDDGTCPQYNPIKENTEQGGVDEVWIERWQYTRYAQERLHPELYLNKEYWEYKNVSSGISSTVCTYGYQLRIGKRNGHYKYFWLPIQSLLAASYERGKKDGIEEYKKSLTKG